MTPFQQANEDARRLTKITGRDVEAITVHCCNYDKTCGCGGEGISYECRYSFCRHVVQDGDDLECEENDCADREYKAFCKRTELVEVG